MDPTEVFFWAFFGFAIDFGTDHGEILPAGPLVTLMVLRRGTLG